MCRRPMGATVHSRHRLHHRHRPRLTGRDVLARHCHVVERSHWHRIAAPRVPGRGQSPSRPSPLADAYDAGRARSDAGARRRRGAIVSASRPSASRRLPNGSRARSTSNCSAGGWWERYLQRAYDSGLVAGGELVRPSSGIQPPLPAVYSELARRELAGIAAALVQQVSRQAGLAAALTRQKPQLMYRAGAHGNQKGRHDAAARCSSISWP